ncbi:conserved hypothetical protein [Candidatus Brocadia pituitae]|nr:conserved hypothetical protein [Candidatus Brocadia pituitae]
MITKQGYLLFLLILFVIFEGCATRYPLGLKEEQWQALSPQQQAEYTTKQYQIDEERRKRQEEYRQQKEREAVEATRVEKDRILQLYRNARYGDIIQVNISGGSIAFIGERKGYEPLSFDLVRGERKRIPFYHHDRHVTYQTDIWVAYDNNAFYFDIGDDQKYEHSTDKIVILDNGRWDEGKTYHPKTLDKTTYSQAQGIEVFIRYKLLPGMQRKGSHHYYPSQ